MSSYSIFIDHKSKLVKITGTGEFFLEDGKEMISAGRSTAIKHAYNVFYDIRDATTTVPFFSWFQLPRELPVFQVKESRHVKVAILASPQDKAVEDYKFYEVVTSNLGFKTRFFFDEKEALEWLR